MITDSPYDDQLTALSPVEGLVAGATAAGVMLGVLAIGQRVAGVELSWILIHIGATLGRGFIDGSEQAIVAPLGLAVFIIVGAVLGLLYAISQRHVPTRVLIGVGLFYGFILWIIGGLVVGWLFGDELHSVLRSWAWLAASLVYGLTLALAAAWRQQQAPRERTPIPLD